MKKHNVLTIPNLMSFFRLCLVPVIMYVYLHREAYFFAGILVAVSALTDIFDGRVARRFNMVSDVGKILDPLADKITQLAMITCILTKHPSVLVLLIVFVFKEVFQLFEMRYITSKKSEIVSARWFGKLCTACLYTCSLVMFVFPSIPDTVIYAIVCVCSILLMISFAGYLKMFISVFREYHSKKEEA